MPLSDEECQQCSRNVAVEEEEDHKEDRLDEEMEEDSDVEVMGGDAHDMLPVVHNGVQVWLILLWNCQKSAETTVDERRIQWWRTQNHIVWRWHCTSAQVSKHV
jgi:hypothetical protein